MSRLKKGDPIVVISGADRGATGEILMVNRKHGKAIVEGVNMKWKHLRKSQENPQGARVQQEFPLDLSNLAYFDSDTEKGVRLGVEEIEGKRVRVMRPSGKRVDE